MRTVLTFVASVALCVVPSLASASDAKIIPGAICQSNSSSETYGSGPTLINSSTTSTMTVYCPLVRDNTSSATVTVYAADQNSSTSVECYAGNTYISAEATGWWTATASSASSSSTPQAISLGSVSGASTTMLWVECKVPVKSTNSSYISGIYYNET